MSDWTVEQAAELLAEQILYLLDGVDDDDTVRVQIVWEAVAKVWASETTLQEIEWKLPDDMTAGQIRERMQSWRSRLAAGEQIP